MNINPVHVIKIFNETKMLFSITAMSFFCDFVQKTSPYISFISVIFLSNITWNFFILFKLIIEFILSFIRMFKMIKSLLNYNFCVYILCKFKFKYFLICSVSTVKITEVKNKSWKRAIFDSKKV